MFQVGLFLTNQRLACFSHSDHKLFWPSEPISEQSDIETRIRALKEELKKRKSMAYQLKKEQKKRQKERLKAQEANLLKQLQVNVSAFIQRAWKNR